MTDNAGRAELLALMEDAYNECIHFGGRDEDGLAAAFHRVAQLGAAGDPRVVIPSAADLERQAFEEAAARYGVTLQDASTDDSSTTSQDQANLG
jgi:hypothetical protein